MPGIERIKFINEDETKITRIFYRVSRLHSKTEEETKKL
jgi:hypothetical protein